MSTAATVTAIQLLLDSCCLEYYFMQLLQMRGAPRLSPFQFLSQRRVGFPSVAKVQWTATIHTILFAQHSFIHSLVS